jgi:hypothetical protein
MSLLNDFNEARELAKQIEAKRMTWSEILTKQANSELSFCCHFCTRNLQVSVRNRFKISESSVCFELMSGVWKFDKKPAYGLTDDEITEALIILNDAIKPETGEKS